MKTDYAGNFYEAFAAVVEGREFFTDRYSNMTHDEGEFLAKVVKKNGWVAEYDRDDLTWRFRPPSGVFPQQYLLEALRNLVASNAPEHVKAAHDAIALAEGASLDMEGAR